MYREYKEASARLFLGIASLGCTKSALATVSYASHGEK